MTASEDRPDGERRSFEDLYATVERAASLVSLKPFARDLIALVAAVERERDALAASLREQDDQTPSAKRSADYWLRQLQAAEARLEAVNALCDAADNPFPPRVTVDGWRVPGAVGTTAIRAALSVAPQPQPDADNTRVPVTEYQRQPQPARCDRGICGRPSGREGPHREQQR